MMNKFIIQIKNFLKDNYQDIIRYFPGQLKKNKKIELSETQIYPFGKNLKLPKGSPKKLAELVYKKKNINFKKIYFPFWWGLIAFLLKIIPINFLIKLIKNSKS